MSSRRSFSATCRNGASSSARSAWARRRNNRRRSVDHRQATAHAQHLTRQVIRFVAREKQDRVGDFGRFGEAAEGNRAHQGFALFLRYRCQQRRIGRTRTHTIHVDREARGLTRERFRESNDRALRTGIDRFASTAGAPGITYNTARRWIDSCATSRVMWTAPAVSFWVVQFDEP